MNLLKIFSNINVDTKTLSYADIKVLYSLCLKIACGYIAKVHSDKFCSKNRWNDNIDDVASDAIVPLFIQNEHGTIHIINSYNHWNSKILTENDARFFLSRLVWSRVEQRMAKVLKERDPIFNKIHKTLMNCIDGEVYKKQTFFGKAYFVRGSADEIFAPVINYDDFNELPAAIFYKKRSKLLEELFNFIASHTIYFPAIPVNILVNRIKVLYAGGIEITNNVHPICEQEIDLNNVLKKCLLDVEEKLKTKYCSTNKLNEEECELIANTFYQVSLDLKNGGMKGSLFSYMNDVDKSIRNDEFYSKYHGIVNYLFKSFKADIEEFINYE
ncbi:MAG: hypothetical protein HND52_16360 [Ignavibacteriae bacterium]|nr:hypothetical protein [Ignavibacteriota bacterium]NOG99531.1 hypothetical protein [Ignavibacteriota bacterium]